jgi:alpha-tubulin suppressor-like RCC1 family protein
LGNGVTGTESTTPVSVTGIGTTRVAASAIAAGDQHTCAIAYDPLNTIAPSYVKCWGNNADGRLGNGTTGGDYSTPVNVPGTYGAMSIAAGERHTCAVLNTGGVRCWGYNGTGQLGDGTTTTRPSPVVVSGITDATQVTAGIQHSCVRTSTSSGRASCWGNDAYGQLGDIDPPTTKLTPSPVVLFLETQQVSAGAYFACAWVAGAGLQPPKIYCWGRNNQGQLGSNLLSPWLNLPAQTPIPSYVNNGPSPLVSYVSAGADHACALIDYGTSKRVLCWGSNTYGQLGNGRSGGNALPGLVEPAPCSMDIDADGQISIDTDWQIMARARLGLKGDPLTSGLLGANAVRKTWPDIRSYLETSCGMTGLVP